MSERIEIKRSVREENAHLAKLLNERLRGEGIFTINILGSPGAGKTSSLKQIIQRLSGNTVSVIEGDVASDIDTQALRALGIDAYQIETGGGCHLNVPMVEAILKQMTLKPNGWLFIENIGNLICPVAYPVGEDLNIVIASTAEGSDKPYKYPAVFRNAAAVILTKKDLAPHVGFDMEFFTKGVRALNPEANIFEVNALTGEGFDEATNWLKSQRNV